MEKHNLLSKIKPSKTPFKGKAADFLLAASVTQTCTIEGITQAGIPGLIPLTPTLDAEFVATGMVYSLDNIAETPKGVPTPALISRAVHCLAPFASINIINLGLQTLPQHCTISQLNINPSQKISEDAQINAQEIFNKGLEFARQYKLIGDYIILGESTPAGTTTAHASAKALGYSTTEMFASSFKHSPDSIKKDTITASLKLINENMSHFEKLSICSDNMLIFCAGFVAQISQITPVVLAGGTQMATVLLIINSLYQQLGLKFNPQNIHLMTTQWIKQDKYSDIEALLNQLSFTIKAYYSEFDFSLSAHPALKLYDQGEAKEGVGAGAAIAYAYAHGINKQQITSQVEQFLS